MMSRERFETMYASPGSPPWDIGHAQPAMMAAVERGVVAGEVLDSGCGTGELALWLAARGHKVLGIDVVPAALEHARAKSVERGLTDHVEFQPADALNLESIGRAFDTVVDCGLFHTFDNADRARYVDGLGHVLRPGGRFLLLCFSDLEPLGTGPRRVAAAEIQSAFDDADWRVESIERVRFEVAPSHSDKFSPGGPHALLAVIQRTGDLAPPSH